MLNIKALACFVIIAVVCSTTTAIVVRSHYEETITYWGNPECKPSKLDKGLQCCNIGDTVEVKGGLVSIRIRIFILNKLMFHLSGRYINSIRIMNITMCLWPQRIM